MTISFPISNLSFLTSNFNGFVDSYKDIYHKYIVQEDPFHIPLIVTIILYLQLEYEQKVAYPKELEDILCYKDESFLYLWYIISLSKLSLCGQCR